MKLLLPIGAGLAALILGACEPAAPPEAPPPEAEPPVVSAPSLTPVWDFISSGEGVALILKDPGGDAVLNLGCLRDPVRMTLFVSGLTPIDSEERLSFGVDDEPFVFVADSTTAGPGVRGETAVAPDLLARMSAATGFAASYGAQTAGPYEPPPAELRQDFVAECREIAGG